MLDKLGIFISGLCVVHCLMIPGIILFSPVIADELIAQDASHMFLFIAVAATSSLSFIPGYRTHKHVKPLIISIIGLFLLCYAAFFAHNAHGHELELIISVAASVLLIGAHILNHALCKKCSTHTCRDIS